MDVDIKQEAQSVLERLTADYAGARRVQGMLQAEYDQQVSSPSNSLVTRRHTLFCNAIWLRAGNSMMRCGANFNRQRLMQK